MLIGISGKIGSGKTEVVKILVANGFTELNFATKLKEAVSLVFDIPLEQLNSQVGKATIDDRWGCPPRYLLQRFGTEVCRVLHPKTWTYHLEKSIQEDPSKNYVVGDVRFINEFQFVIDHGGVMWRVCRPDLKPDDPHPSEISLDVVEHHIYLDNDGTLEDLKTKVMGLLDGTNICP